MDHADDFTFQKQKFLLSNAYRKDTQWVINKQTNMKCLREGFDEGDGQMRKGMGKANMTRLLCIHV